MADKQRFALDPATDRIRANQGHSIPVALGLTPQTPPAVLFHGTVATALPGIAADGYVFYLSANRVWLTEQVPARYVTGLPAS